MLTVGRWKGCAPHVPQRMQIEMLTTTTITIVTLTSLHSGTDTRHDCEIVPEILSIDGRCGEGLVNGWMCEWGEKVASQMNGSLNSGST